MANKLDTNMVLEIITQQKQLSRDQQIADRIDRVGFLLEQVLTQASTIALATVIPAADSVYVDSAGKPFGPIV